MANVQAVKATVLGDDPNYGWDKSVQDYIVGDRVLVCSDGKMCYLVALPALTHEEMKRIRQATHGDDATIDLGDIPRDVADAVAKVL